MGKSVREGPRVACQEMVEIRERSSIASKGVVKGGGGVAGTYGDERGEWWVMVGVMVSEGLR